MLVGAAIVLLPFSQFSEHHRFSLQAYADGSTAPIYLGLSVIWEGDHLKAHNLKTISRIRHLFPAQPVMHFLSPAYFVKPDSDVATSAARVRALIHPQDQVGLYLQPWKSIVSQVGAIFRSGPTFWGNKITDCPRDCGREVPLSVYSEKEISDLIAYSLDIFQKNKLAKPTMFMAGGWISSQAVRNELPRFGISYDFSMIPPALLARRLSGFPLLSWLENRSEVVTSLTQPYRVDTTTSAITQFNLSAGVVDFVTPREMSAVFTDYVKEHKKNPSEPLVFNIGLHQETADLFSSAD